MTRETTRHGLGVSAGVAYGPAYIISPDNPRIPHFAIEPSAISAEIDRFDTALAETRADIERVRDALIAASKGDEATIFDAHLLLLEDPELVQSTHQKIDGEHVNAEYAFYTLLLDSVDQLASSEDAYLRERVKDLRDVKHRVVRTLLGQREPVIGDLMQNAILIAHDLPATLTAELDRDRVLGFATEGGAATSHTSILARALEIPAVIGLGPTLHRMRHGQPVILDGEEGVLIENPSEKTRARYAKVRAEMQKRRERLVGAAGKPGLTADGTGLSFEANIEFPREVDAALAYGCEGIGLYRTEYLFLKSGGEPSEDDQFETYRKVVKRLDGRPVTVRTIDLGGDKLLRGMEPEENPFLGWRGIRYCLDRPEVFQAQMRAILRAGAGGQVKILLPMLTSVDEADRALEHVEIARRSLADSGIPYAEEAPIGVLIETPAAALLIEDLVGRFDFVSLGTNDLTQYTLAVDRGNRRISHLFRPMHPAVLRLVERVVEVSGNASREVTVCGEMASYPRSAALLLGLGIRKFSMVSSRIPRIKQVLGRIELAEAQEVAGSVMKQPTAELAMGLIEQVFAERFHHADDEQ